MDFNFDDYGAELDRLTGNQNLSAAQTGQTDQYGQPTSNLAQADSPAPQGGASQPANLGAEGTDAGPSPSGGASDNKIPVMPPGFDADKAFDQDKLKEVKTVPQLVDAMHPAARTEFMDWWEQQNGSINQHYDQLHQQIGVKPDPDRKLSKKEKWTALMEFGIHLIQASGPNERGEAPGLGSALANATGATVQGLNQQRNLEGAEYDQKASAIEGGRQTALKNLGTYGEALKGQAAIDTGRAREAMYNRPTATQQPKNLQIEQDNEGYMRQIQPGGTAKRITDPDTGKPVKGLMPTGGGNGAASNSTYAQKHRDLTSMYKTSGLSDAESANAATKLLTTSTTKGVNKASLRIQAAKLAHSTLGQPDYYSPAQHGGKSYEQMESDLTDANYDQLIGLAEPNDTSNPTPTSVTPAGPRKVTTKADYDALPSGTKYLAPDGSTRTKK